jgi:hypothetical protein
MRPGGIIDTDDAKGIQMIQYPPAVVDAFTEIDASDSRAQRRTGANQLVTQGTAPSAGQLGRTSAGIQTANAALGARMGYWMDQVTSLMFKPALEAIFEMDRQWLPEDEIKDFFHEELQEAFQGDPLEIKNANLKFEMLAGSKLRQRMAMLQVAPTLTQMLMIQPVLEAISDQQKKVDWVELMQVLLDATGWPGAQKFIVDMTQQDMQQMQQKQQMALQMNQISMKHQAAMAEEEQKARGQAGVHIVRGLIDHMNPESRMNALATLQSIMQGGDNAGQNQQAQGAPDQPASPDQGQTPGGQGQPPS